MRKFRNVKTRKKIFTIISIAVISLALIGSVGYYFMCSTFSNAKEIYEQSLTPIKDIGEMRRISAINDSLLYKIVTEKDRGKQQELINQMNDNSKLINKIQAGYMKTIDDEYEKKSIDNLNAVNAEFRNKRTQMVDLAAAGKNDEALALYNTSKPLLDKVNEIRLSLADRNAKEASDDMNDISNHFNTATLLFIIVSVLSAVVMIILGSIIERMITIPLDIMVKKVEAVAAGNIIIEEDKIVSKDELGRLAASIRHMVKNLHNLVQQVTDSADLVSNLSDELTSSAEQYAVAAEEVTSSISSIASGAEAQNTEVRKTTELVENIAVSISKASENINTVESLSLSTSQAAKDGNDTIDAAIAQMSNIEVVVNNSSKTVQEMNGYSQEIGCIIETITGIASQTNLLALNAAIEAARAGEQGKGFSVVADEVRKLAEQSQESAKYIAELVKKVQDSTEKAVMSMNEGMNEVQVGKEMVAAAGEKFMKISSAINDVNANIHHAAQGNDRIKSSSSEIVASINEIYQTSQEASAGVQIVVGANEEQALSIEQIVSSSQGLSELAEKLRNHVHSFELS